MFADQMAGGRRFVLSASHASNLYRRFFDDIPYKMQAPSTPCVSRHYQRVSVWADPGDPQWTSFAEENMCVVPRHTRGEVNGSDSLDLGLAAERVLIWLRMTCDAHEKVGLRLAQRLGRYPRGLRLNAHASVIGAALYKLVAAYDLVQESHTIFDLDLRDMKAKGNALYGKSMARYGADESDIPELDFRLMQLEMFGMFAKLLLMYKNETPLKSVSWLELPHPIEYAPSWSVRKSPNGLSIRIRSRVNEKTLARLIQRLWMAQLIYVPTNPIGSDSSWRDNQLDSVWHEKREMDTRPRLSGKTAEIREPIRYRQ